MNDPGPFVVKVQLPLFTTEPVPLALIYNKDRSRKWMPPAASFEKALGGKVKAFFEARERPDGSIELLRETKDPGW